MWTNQLLKFNVNSWMDTLPIECLRGKPWRTTIEMVLTGKQGHADSCSKTQS